MKGVIPNETKRNEESAGKVFPVWNMNSVIDKRKFRLKKYKKSCPFLVLGQPLP